MEFEKEIYPAATALMLDIPILVLSTETADRRAVE